MYGCQQELIKSPQNVPFLEYLCTTANKLINCGIYLARQWYFKLGYITGKSNLEKPLKSNVNYQFLYSQAAYIMFGKTLIIELRSCAKAPKTYVGEGSELQTKT